MRLLSRISPGQESYCMNKKAPRDSLGRMAWLLLAKSAALCGTGGWPGLRLFSRLQWRQLGPFSPPFPHPKFQGALRRHRFPGQNKFERNLGSDEKGQNCGCERRENADADLRLRKSRFGRGNHKITESGQLRAAADCRSVHDAHDGLADFQHTCEGRVKGVEHLKHTL